MYRHLLILPDGRELFSGADRLNALQSVKLTQMVNAGEDLTLGSVCAAMLDAALITPGGELSLGAGDTVTLMQVDETGTRRQLGVFYLEKPTRPSAHTMRLTAYDAVSRLDRDLSEWLSQLEQWPYSVGEFAQLVCLQCGVHLVEAELPNADFYIQPFTAEGVTGRHLMQWLGQITGRFCRATATGDLEFAWYAPNDAVSVGAEAGQTRTFYYQGKLSFEDYAVTAVEKVQLRQNPEDVGTVWPQETGQRNTYVIENNPMLAAQDGETLLGVAQTLYEQLKTLSYTPCRVEIPADHRISAGDIVQVRDLNGRQMTVWVMEKSSDGQRDTLVCTGGHRRDTTTVVNGLNYRALSGRVMNLRLDVDGLKLENKDTQGRLAAIDLDLEGIRTRAESQSGTLQELSSFVSTLNQTARNLTLELETLRQTGSEKVKTTTGYTFDEQGLRITRSDSDMDNTLDHTGMCVRRNGEILLQANNQGVQARDVTVSNYLVVGEHTRFEDYGGDRTACYYIG